MKIILVIALVCSFLVCKAQDQQPYMYSSVLDKKFNKKIIVDTSDCLSYHFRRGIVGIFKNAKAVVLKYHTDRYLKMGNMKLWVCNMPKQISKCKIGDTVLISGNAYNIAGDERMIGHPTILTEIRLKK
jgi:hypothetical protein